MLSETANGEQHFLITLQPWVFHTSSIWDHWGTCLPSHFRLSFGLLLPLISVWNNFMKARQYFNSSKSSVRSNHPIEKKDIVTGQICQIVFLCQILLWKHLLLKIDETVEVISEQLYAQIWQYSFINFWELNGLLYCQSDWVISNTSLYLLWEERTEVLEQLSFLIEKSKIYKKAPFSQTALSPPWYMMRFSPILFCLVLKTLRGSCTQRGWDGLRTWFAMLIQLADLDTVSVFSKRDQRMALCALFRHFPHTWHCVCPEGISAFNMSASSLFEARGLEATRKGCSAVGTSLSFWQVEVFSLVDQGIWQPCCQGINNLDYLQFCGFF